MGRSVVAVLLVLGVVAPAAAAASGSTDPLLQKRAHAVFDQQPAPTASTFPRDARLEKCKEAKPGGMCGTVTVPLDRADPAKGTIDIFFAFFPHRDPGPATSAILVTEGGPGLSVTQDQFLRTFYPDTFRPLMDTRDLILLDQRGVGKSGAIDCPKVQHAKGPIRDAVRECGEQLGATANLYASDNVALDIEAVRASLGIDKLDFYGGSNAAQDIQAYAARFPEHLRSAVLDTPVTTIDWDVFDHRSPTAWLRASKLICRRSPTCAGAHHNNTRSIAWLARRLRDEPLEGTGYDPEGNRHSVRVTESTLVWGLLGNDSGGYVAPSEIGAAARALRNGDRVPLLRLAAEAEGPFFGDEGRATQFSNGESFARYCTDVPMPWDKAASREERLAQYEAARAALPSNAFAPFSIGAWLAPLPAGPIGPDVCLDWPAPDPDVPTPIPPGAELPGNVPALIIGADLDVATPFSWARLINKAWPNSRLVKLENGPHHAAVPTSGLYECVDAIIVKFIADLDAGSAECASEAPEIWPAVGRFPRTAGQARQARSADGDHSTLRDRRIATVVTATVTDALRRNFMVPGGSNTPGLRGGVAKVRINEAGDGLVTRFDNTRFARNVSVNGESAYDFNTEAIDAEVDVDASHGERGTLHIEGVWFPFLAKAGSFKIHGKLNGHEVRVRVPAT